MVSASKSDEQSGLESILGPSIFETEDGARIAQKLQELISGGLETSPFEAPLQSLLTDPGAQGPSEADFIRAVTALSTGGPGAATTASGLNEALAPGILQFRNNQIGNLQRAFGQDIQGQLGNRELTGRGLAELAGLAAPQIVAGQTQAGKGRPLIKSGGFIGSSKASLGAIGKGSTFDL